MMDVILLKDVEKLGTVGSVVHVRPGYARNYLLPAGLAVAASPEQLKVVEQLKAQRQKKAQQLAADAAALKRKIEERSLTLKLTVGEDDQPFGSVTAHDIVEALAKEGLSVEKSAIRLEEPVKSLGIFEVPLRLHADVTATLKLWVVKA
jgi:large subunit ribosomal protein L9